MKILLITLLIPFYLIAGDIFDTMDTYNFNIEIAGIYKTDRTADDLRTHKTDITGIIYNTSSNLRDSDLVDLDTISNLQHLEITNNLLKSIDLSNFIDLDYVNLNHNVIDYVLINEDSPIEYLNISYNNLLNLNFSNSPTDLSSYTFINLSHNNITNISYFDKFTNLETLKLDNNNISDIKILENLENITDFTFDKEDIYASYISDGRADNDKSFCSSTLINHNTDYCDNNMFAKKASEYHLTVGIDLNDNGILESSEIKTDWSESDIYNNRLLVKYVKDSSFPDDKGYYYYGIEQFPNITNLKIYTNNTEQFISKLTNLKNIYLYSTNTLNSNYILPTSIKTVDLDGNANFDLIETYNNILFWRMKNYNGDMSQSTINGQDINNTECFIYINGKENFISTNNIYNFYSLKYSFNYNAVDNSGIKNFSFENNNIKHLTFSTNNTHIALNLSFNEMSNLYSLRLYGYSSLESSIIFNNNINSLTYLYSNLPLNNLYFLNKSQYLKFLELDNKTYTKTDYDFHFLNIEKIKLSIADLNNLKNSIINSDNNNYSALYGDATYHNSPSIVTYNYSTYHNAYNDISFSSEKLPEISDFCKSISVAYKYCKADNITLQTILNNDTQTTFKLDNDGDNIIDESIISGNTNYVDMKNKVDKIIEIDSKAYNINGETLNLFNNLQKIDGYNDTTKEIGKGTLSFDMNNLITFPISLNYMNIYNFNNLSTNGNLDNLLSSNVNYLYLNYSTKLGNYLDYSQYNNLYYFNSTDEKIDKILLAPNIKKITLRYTNVSKDFNNLSNNSIIELNLKDETVKNINFDNFPNLTTLNCKNFYSTINPIVLNNLENSNINTLTAPNQYYDINISNLSNKSFSGNFNIGNKIIKPLDKNSNFCLSDGIKNSVNYSFYCDTLTPFEKVLQQSTLNYYGLYYKTSINENYIKTNNFQDIIDNKDKIVSFVFLDSPTFNDNNIIGINDFPNLIEMDGKGLTFYDTTLENLINIQNLGVINHYSYDNGHNYNGITIINTKDNITIPTNFKFLNISNLKENIINSNNLENLWIDHTYSNIKISSTMDNLKKLRLKYINGDIDFNNSSFNNLEYLYLITDNVHLKNFFNKLPITLKYINSLGNFPDNSNLTQLNNIGDNFISNSIYESYDGYYYTEDAINNLISSNNTTTFIKADEYSNFCNSTLVNHNTKICKSSLDELSSYLYSSDKSFVSWIDFNNDNIKDINEICNEITSSKCYSYEDYKNNLDKIKEITIASNIDTLFSKVDNNNILQNLSYLILYNKNVNSYFTYSPIILSDKFKNLKELTIKKLKMYKNDDYLQNFFKDFKVDKLKVINYDNGLFNSNYNSSGFEVKDGLYIYSYPFNISILKNSINLKNIYIKFLYKQYSSGNYINNDFFNNMKKLEYLHLENNNSPFPMFDKFNLPNIIYFYFNGYSETDFRRFENLSFNYKNSTTDFNGNIINKDFYYKNDSIFNTTNNSFYTSLTHLLFLANSDSNLCKSDLLTNKDLYCLSDKSLFSYIKKVYGTTKIWNDSNNDNLRNNGETLTTINNIQTDIIDNKDNIKEIYYSHYIPFPYLASLNTFHNLTKLDLGGNNVYFSYFNTNFNNFKNLYNTETKQFEVYNQINNPYLTTFISGNNCKSKIFLGFLNIEDLEGNFYDASILKYNTNKSLKKLKIDHLFKTDLTNNNLISLQLNGFDSSIDNFSDYFYNLESLRTSTSPNKYLFNNELPNLKYLYVSNGLSTILNSNGYSYKNMNNVPNLNYLYYWYSHSNLDLTTFSNLGNFGKTNIYYDNSDKTNYLVFSNLIGNNVNKLSLSSAFCNSISVLSLKNKNLTDYLSLCGNGFNFIITSKNNNIELTTNGSSYISSLIKGDINLYNYYGLTGNQSTDENILKNYFYSSNGRITINKITSNGNNEIYLDITKTLSGIDNINIDFIPDNGKNVLNNKNIRYYDDDSISEIFSDYGKSYNSIENAKIEKNNSIFKVGIFKDFALSDKLNTLYLFGQLNKINVSSDNNCIQPLLENGKIKIDNNYLYLKKVCNGDSKVTITINKLSSDYQDITPNSTTFYIKDYIPPYTILGNENIYTNDDKTITEDYEFSDNSISKNISNLSFNYNSDNLSILNVSFKNNYQFSITFRLNGVFKELFNITTDDGIQKNIYVNDNSFNTDNNDNLNVSGNGFLMVISNDRVLNEIVQEFKKENINIGYVKDLNDVVDEYVKKARETNPELNKKNKSYIIRNLDFKTKDELKETFKTKLEDIYKINNSDIDNNISYNDNNNLNSD